MDASQISKTPWPCYFCGKEATREVDTIPLCDYCIEPSDLDAAKCCVECGSPAWEGHEVDCLRNPRN